MNSLDGDGSRTHRGESSVPESGVMDILASHGIHVPDRIVVEDLPERMPLDYPLVLKVSDARILHKTDVGGVQLNIRDRDDLRTRFAEMKASFPTSKFLIERMEKPGVEVIVGLGQDSTFDLVVIVGLGGTYTELYRDVAIRVLPIEGVDADEMISETRTAKLFDGFRGIRANREALKDILLKVSRVGEDLADRVEQLDLNPIFVRERDAVVVDAKLILR